MTVDSLNAANAYRNQLKLMENAGDVGGSEETAGSSFAQLVKDAIHEASDTQYKAEHTEMQAMSGKVDLSELVTAVANAELSLNTVVAVRDRVIAAYNDIIKMAI